MKGFFIILVMLFPSTLYAEPSIRFESELYDFGTVKTGDLLKYSFEFINAGTSDLLIKKIIPS
jgi:hypothetical protein